MGSGLKYAVETLEFTAKEGDRRSLCTATAKKSYKQMTLTRFSKNLNLQVMPSKYLRSAKK
jgi:hypothetical protein